MSSKMKNCKHCGAEIAASAKVCPSCGGKNKKPIYKRIWFIVLALIIILGIFGSMFGGGNKSTSSSKIEKEETTTEEKTIEYTKYNVSTLIEDLKGNALNASDKYKGQYVELKGRLSNIDSSGAYIDIDSESDDFTFYQVQCYIKNDEQKEVVKKMSIDEIVVIRGKIKDVGEVLGYSLDIDEIVQ